MEEEIVGGLDYIFGFEKFELEIISCFVFPFFLLPFLYRYIYIIIDD